MGIETAIIGSAIIGAGASAMAAKKQGDAADQAGKLTMAQYNQNRSLLSPWVSQGKAAGTTLSDYLGTAPTSGPDWDAYLKMYPDVAASAMYGANPAQHYEDWGKNEGRTVPVLSGGNPTANTGSLLKPYTGESLTTDPGYQFGLSEGEKGIDRAARARGSFNSGATMKALLKYNEDYAGTKFNEGFNRDQTTKGNIYSMLSGVSNTGANSAGMTAGLGASAAGATGNYLTQGADAGAAGLIGGANAANAGVGSYLQYQNNQSMMDYLKTLRGSTFSDPNGRVGVVS